MEKTADDFDFDDDHDPGSGFTDEPEFRRFGKVDVYRVATPRFDILETVAQAVPHKRVILEFCGAHLEAMWFEDPTTDEMDAVDAAWKAVGGTTAGHNRKRRTIQ